MWNTWKQLRRLALPGRDWNGWPKVAFAAYTFLFVIAWSHSYRALAIAAMCVVVMAAGEVMAGEMLP